MHDQIAMAGDDCLSDSDRKRQARAEAARKKAGMKCAKALQAAADALSEYSMACNACNDASGIRGADDGRVLLAEDNREFAYWLENKYGKE